MTPESLRLKGFAGIRSGLGQDEVALDISKLAKNAQLIALSGPNGKGKSTLLDNLHPYRLMPSRATSYSPDGFSFYDQLSLPECAKELVWSHKGVRYKSVLAWKINGKRKAEAYLYEERSGAWVPVQLPDGTLSDGKTETYDACVQAVLGNPETFFTSVFAAQGRKPLSAYATGEIKSLMVDLLRLESIRAAGEKAGGVVRGLKAHLAAWQEKRRGLGDPAQRIERLEVELQGMEVLAQTLVAERQEIIRDRAGLENILAQAQAQAAQQARAREQQVELGRRLTRLNEQLAGLLRSHSEGIIRATQRRESAEKSLGALRQDTYAQIDGMEAKAKALQTVVNAREVIQAAAGRLEALDCELSALSGASQTANENLAKYQALAAEVKVLEARKASIEKEAGTAALRAQDLKKRFGLTNEVPCQGLEIQGTCKLLGDANSAKAMIPTADGTIARLNEELQAVLAEMRLAKDALAGLANADAQARKAHQDLERVQATRRGCAEMAAKAGELAQAQARLQEIEESRARLVGLLAEAIAGTEEVAKQTADEIARRSQAHESERGRLEAEKAEVAQSIANLGQADGEDRVTAARSALDVSRQRESQIEAMQVKTATEMAVLKATLATARSNLDQVVLLDAQIGKLTGEIDGWRVLTKGLSNDGVIALCIDDAGPELARLANELLLSCYGPRFTVSIQTQVETAKKELREGFEVLVFDAQTGQSKPVGVMSGGERVWIQEALTRAIALYLAQHAGQRYECLFCDEADGPLDIDRKRMFMQMKREVLRLGGYRHEFFVSQTPELTAMADATIDLAAIAQSPVQHSTI